MASPCRPISAIQSGSLVISSAGGRTTASSRGNSPSRLGVVYPSDLTNGQWAVIEPMIPDAVPGGRPRRASKREIVEAILYLLRAGSSWRLLPHDFLPWRTVYCCLRRSEREGVRARVHHALVMTDRERAGR